MKFDIKWPSWADPRKLPLDRLKPGYVATRDFLVKNRNAVLASSLALMIGLWSGAVLGAAGTGGGGGGVFDIVGLSTNAESARSANAPRAGLPVSDRMEFIRLRQEMGGTEPRACLEFSRNLSTASDVNYADYISLDPTIAFQTDVSANLLCLAGLPFEPERQLTIREGLPAADGSKTEAEETFTLSFGDRPAYVGFAGSGVILPRNEADGLAIETVNVSKLEIEVLRVNDRILSQHSIEPGEINEEGGWNNWSFNYAASDVGEQVYEGTIDIEVGARRNQAVTTVFALGAALGRMRPGAYVVKVKDGTPGAGSGRGDEGNNDSPASAYRWIMYTDMALQTFSGATGVDVVVRSLASARTMGNVRVALIAQNNEELAAARSDNDGRVHFSEALVNGDGPMRARYVMAYGADGDFSALDLNRGALDLSDRDVGGRRAPGDIDAYLYTERGIYRPGERVRLIGLIRDQIGRGISNRPSTLVLYRPNGTEARRIRMTEAVAAGGIAKNIELDRGAPRGQWRATLLVDGQEAIAGEVSFSVEDFVPQRLRVAIDANESVLRPGQSRPVSVQADFLYGAPGSGLAVEGTGRLSIDPNPFPELPGYTWGVSDESFNERMFTLPETVTDGTGRGELIVSVADLPESSMPLRARVVVGVADPGGRMVRESFSLPVRTETNYLGLKPRFENRRAGSGERTVFETVAVNSDGRRVGLQGVQWRIVREDWNYDWYLDGGSWRWRRSGRDINVDGGTINVAANAPALIDRDDLRDGSYRLIVTHASGAETSTRFGVGWGGPADDDATPDMVTVVAPENPTRPGARARVQIRPPYAGEAQIVVATDRVIETRTVRVSAAGTNVELPVSAEWGSGAYVLVTVMTPRDPQNLPVPRRAVGVAYVPVDMGNRTLEVAVGEGMQPIRPRTQVQVPIQVRNVPGGERVHVAIAAVDEGILNLTKYESPNPVDYFFGRRALGVDIRDDYGRLLNPNLGAPALARQGGDSLGGEGLTVVPTKTVSLFSDLVTLDGSGRATIPLDIPDFNGTLRLMAVAWSQTALGQDAEQVVVRDPVVAELILPRFLAPGDEAMATLNIDNVEGPAGSYSVTVGGDTIASITQTPRRFQLGRGQRQTAQIPVTGGPLGIGRITLRLEGPNGFTAIDRSYDIQSRAPFLPITLSEVALQNPAASWRAPSDALARFLPGGDSRALISFSNFGAYDPVPLLDELYRYPYGCSEQLTSVAMPLLYFNTLAAEVGVTQDARLRRRVQEAVTTLLDRQNPDGSFGLWRAGDGYAQPWLGAYITDFLTRAKAQGYAVPQSALDLAYNSMRRMARVNEGAPGYQYDVYSWPGSTETAALLRSRSAAYALYVLAKAGRADIGQVRHFHNALLRDEPSPLARAQIGAALAHLGDRARARDAFRQAERALGYRNTGDWYQTPLRDLAGVLAYAVEAGEMEMAERLRRRLDNDVRDPDSLMTQEQVRLLLAVYALRERAGEFNVSLNGTRMTDRRLIATAPDLLRGLVFRNDGRGEIWRTTSVSGAPIEAPPAMQAGYKVTKRVFRMDGAPADLNSVRQGDRLIVVLQVDVDGARTYPTVVVDLLPSGLEIESVLTAEDGANYYGWDGMQRNGPFAWIGRISWTNVAEARDDRFVASRDIQGEGLTLAYMARAVTPGRFTMPAVQAEDMYRPEVLGRSDTGVIRIAPRGG